MSCSDCFRGGVVTSHPTGIETTVHGLPTYVAQPDDGVTPNGVIVFITDAFGWKFANNRVLADHYAKKGRYLVYCPDFMKGRSLDPSIIPLMDKIMAPASWTTAIFYKPLWVFQTMAMAIPWKVNNKIPATHPPIISFLQAVRTSAPPFSSENLKIGVAGFCWGGKHAILLAQDVETSRLPRHQSQINHESAARLVDCIFTAHPSYIEVPVDIEPISVPVSVAIGSEDNAIKAPQVQHMKEILESKKDAEHEVFVFAGARHGFAVRNHPEDKLEVECAEKAEVQAIEWFKRWLG